MRGKPFQLGHARLGGRTKGQPNYATGEVRTLARRLLSDREYRKNLRQRLREGTAAHIEALLWHYAYGKPKEGPERSGPVELRVVYDGTEQRRVEVGARELSAAHYGR